MLKLPNVAASSNRFITILEETHLTFDLHAPNFSHPKIVGPTLALVGKVSNYPDLAKQVDFSISIATTILEMQLTSF